MRAFLFGFVPFLMLTIFARWYFVCKIHHLCGDEPIKEIIERSKTLDLTDEDNGTIILDDFEEFSFKKGSELPELSDNNKQFLDGVAQYLKKEPTKNLSITGHYLEAEKNIKKGFYENLGQARANEVREYLINQGIEEERFAVDYNMITDETLDKPLVFETFEPSAEAGKLVKEKFTFTNISYSEDNFGYNSDVFNPGQAFKSYADSVQVFLAENPEKTLTIIGHTDNVGSDNYNDDLGQRRAESAKAYFGGIGITNTINTVSMGKRQPVADNSTEKGRQKNRRVNFKIE